MNREKKQSNKFIFPKKTYTLLLVLFILLTSIGYSALNENLSISGEVYFAVGNICEATSDSLQCTAINHNGGMTAIENKGAPNFSTQATTNEGMYAIEEAGGTSYYYRGAVENNNVIFAGFQWKIIRIANDGSIRLIYNGECENNNCAINNGGPNTKIGSSAFNEIITSNAYVGYMYGTPNSDNYIDEHSNINNSTIKTYIDDWYKNNLLNQGKIVTDKIADSAFCGDRRISYEGILNGNTSLTNLGYGIHHGYYDTNMRLFAYEERNPTLSCNQHDYYTVGNLGNSALTYPIGLITVDEAAMAGAIWTAATGIEGNSAYYLSTGEAYWTMSPSAFWSISAYTWNVSANGGIDGFISSNSIGIRPVISLNRNVRVLSGNGTTSSPYIIDTKEITTPLRLTITGPFTTSTGSTALEWANSGEIGYYRIVVDSTSFTLDSNKIIATNGSVGTITGVGTSSNPYIVPVTVASGNDGEAHITIETGAFKNNKGETNATTISKNFMVDTTPPTITVNPTTVTIDVGTSYNIMTGVLVTDNLDQNITVTTTGTFNPNSVGTYTIRYNAMDKAGNSATERTRTIIVQTNITLTNLVSNGSFETNTTGWTGSHTLSRQTLTPNHGETGSWAGQVSGSVNGAINVTVSPAVSVVNGRRYYIRSQVKNVTNGYANICQYMNNTTALAGISATPTLTVNTWELYDGIWTANSTSLTLRLNFTGGNGNNNRTAQFDNIMVIDLTAAYGSGNEPSIEAIRSLVNNNGGFWNGSLEVSQ